jgi:hypothetical protein
VLLGQMPELPLGLEEAVRFPLVEALLGRRARRFPLGATIPDGPLAYTSEHPPLPLGDLEQMLVLCAVAGNTGWINLHPHNPNYSPKIPNYAGAAGGRTFPSSAGFHTTECFYTDDDGVYFLPTRDAGLLAQRDQDGALDLHGYLRAHRGRLRNLADGRLHIPAKPARVEMHNPWAVNQPGSTLIFPVAAIRRCRGSASSSDRFALVAAERHRLAGRIRGLLSAALLRHARGGGGPRAAQVRSRRALSPCHARALPRQPPRAPPGSPMVRSSSSASH